MKKRIRFNYVEKHSPILDNPGLWKYPGSEAHRYSSLSYWTELAVKLEKACFDGLFLGDALGVYDTYGGSKDAAVREGLSLPIHDPTYLIPAIAAATKHLGLAVTCSLTYDHPYAMARRMSTLDHLTEGRLGWNIVTSNLESAARNFGLDTQIEHDTRYDRGDEFMEVCYKLWELSWEDGAVVQDADSGIFADPSKVKDIGHEGPFFRVPGIHLCDPSPQRTPVLFQAGSSKRGREFAARHAECNFLNAITPEETRHLISDIRSRAEKYGRKAEDILFFPRVVPVVGATEEEARDKLDRYFSFLSTEGTLALLSTWTGTDLFGYTADRLHAFVERKSGGNAYISDYLQRAHPGKQWTIAELARLYAFGGMGNVIVGSPEQVADRLESFIDETGADGFNIGYISRSESLTDFITLVLPILQQRGRAQTEYSEGTYREQLFDRGPYLPASHSGKKVKL
ncbi:LLM class flavin-dependent oxidoreductase [Cohnella abietis]|uniref:N5,N10-methylene tetrahydromethanopterin reductase n=1 Tax=Cohnella abietis TaxID=2507935 RepID=A0A3T1D685_9BACL|nr:LLM class flavin-dependent oxidoreductase [Cohnella abietis]BBI33585.1 N5,N10-methylene tetrahydromethanopterin reductase [Cohnella abietis]